MIAQTRTGRTDNVVMSGAHLDSVPAGPGINDNGSGSAALIEIATKLGGSPKINNAVRFAWWGAEEPGLKGSNAYLAGLTFEEQLDIALYLNYDMIASPNAGYFVYDGDDSDAAGVGLDRLGRLRSSRHSTNSLMIGAMSRPRVPISTGARIMGPSLQPESPPADCSPEPRRSRPQIR